MSFSNLLNISKFVLLIAFLVLINFGANSQVDLKIDTLKAIYTSGTAPFTVKGKIYLSFSIPAGKQASLQMKTNPTGNYNSVGTFGNTFSTNTQTFTTEIPNLNIRVDIYCFKLEIINSNLVSKELCSIPFSKLQGVNLLNQIVFRIGSYQPGTIQNFIRPFISGKCVSDFACTDDFEDFVSLSQPAPPYIVEKPFTTTVRCGEKKVFQVKIDIEGMVSISDTIQNTGFVKVKPPILRSEWAYATVDNNRVRFFWKNDETINDSLTLENKFIIERKDGPSGTFQELPQDPNLVRKTGVAKFEWEFVDNTSTPNKVQHFYRIKYEDFCGNVSPTLDVNPIFLKQEANTFELVWNSENNSKIIDYELEFFDLLTTPPSNTLTIQPKANKYKAQTSNYYRIKAKQFGGDKTYIYSNYTVNDENIKVLNPTIFTPKGDGINDKFRVYCAAQRTFYISIYNRAGQLVYFSDNYEKHTDEGWDGKMINSGADCEEGQYVFQVDVTNSNDKKFTKRGNILLIRNNK
jgi:gliding motility-associated-like protein